MTATRNVQVECIECDIFLSRYESATFELARVHNALDIAERLRDSESIRRLTLEAYDSAGRKRSAKAALVEHRSSHAASWTTLPEAGPQNRGAA